MLAFVPPVLNLFSYRWSCMPDGAKKQKHASPGYHPCSFLLYLFCGITQLALSLDVKFLGFKVDSSLNKKYLKNA